MLCIWWDQNGLISYDELLKSGKTVTRDLYREQLISLKKASTKKGLKLSKHNVRLYDVRRG